jgi:hypothetical protein
VVQLDVVCDLDAVAGAILDNSRFEHVSVASTEDIYSAQDRGLHNWIVIWVGGYNSIRRSGEHNLGDVADAADEFRDGFLAQLPTCLQPRIGEHPGNFAEDVW